MTVFNTVLYHQYFCGKAKNLNLGMANFFSYNLKKVIYLFNKNDAFVIWTNHLYLEWNNAVFFATHKLYVNVCTLTRFIALPETTFTMKLTLAVPTMDCKGVTGQEDPALRQQKKRESLISFG